MTSCGRPGFRAFPVTRADVTLLVDTYDTGGVQIAAGVPRRGQTGDDSTTAVSGGLAE